MPDFNPAQALPPEFDTLPQTVPVLPGQGFTIAGLPSDPDPVGAAIKMAEERARVNRGSMGVPLAPSPPPSLPPAVPSGPIRFDLGEIPVDVSPPAPPPPTLPRPQSAAAPSSPAGNASGGAPPTPAGAALLPGGVPNVPPPAAGPETPISAASDEMQAAAQQELQAKLDVGVQEQLQALAAQDHAEAQARAEQALLEQQANDRRHAEKLTADRQAKFDAAKYHDFWDDRSTGQKIAVGLGIFLGAFGPGQTNAALQIVDNAINRDFERQSKAHKELLASVELSQAAGRELSAHQLADLGAFRHLQAAKLEAVIKQGEAMAAHSKNAFGVAELRSHLAKVRLESAKLQEEATRATQAAVEKKRMDDSSIALQRSAASENYAQAGAARAKTQREGAAAKGQQGEEVMAKVGAKLFPEQRDAIKAVKQIQEADALIEGLSTNPSALQGALSKERLVSIFANGGRPSVVALNMVKKGAGSWLDVTENDIITALTGKEGAGLRKNLMAVAQGVRSERAKEVTTYRKRADSALAGMQKRFPDAVENYKAGIFGGANESASGPPAGARPVTGPNGQRGFLYPDGTIHTADGAVVR